MKSNGNAKVKVKTSIAQKKENFTGALFIAPYLIGYVIFQGLPFLIAVVLGFTNVRYISKLEDASFVGINNFIRMFTVMISSVITSLQNFTTIQALTGGGPGQATTVMSINIIRTAFTNYQTGYASAQALVMFIIVLIITLIQWRGQQKWVNY